MFSPYWNTIAIETVKDIFVRPQTTQLMADLLGVSVTEFLLLTQTFTLPWLVLLGKSDVIKRISEARKDKEGWLACMETSNMVAILAFLLAQRSDDVENFVMSRFKAVSSQFKQVEFSDLMRVEPASQVFHLLKAAGEADDAKKARVMFIDKYLPPIANYKQIHGALQILAQHTNTGPEHSRASTDAVGRFLEQHILGLVARLSEVINDSRDTHAGKEKDRCVKAFAELVRAAKAHTRVARPQVCMINMLESK
jgi:serine/threonine-protein kinase ATR